MFLGLQDAVIMLGASRDHAIDDAVQGMQLREKLRRPTPLALNVVLCDRLPRLILSGGLQIGNHAKQLFLDLCRPVAGEESFKKS